ncbi:MAG: 6-phosphofructokinase [Clostridiales bacterium]|nr:6-phosphofructokinase [Clostridiales bacterium]
MQKNRTLAILSSGGDAPGMNAAIRAVARTAIGRGCRVLGIQRGFQGLVEDATVELGLRSVSDIIHRGGTALYTARSAEFTKPEGFLKALRTLERHGVDALAVIGGDGTFRGALELARHGIEVACIPGTIDNDIACSEYTIGFDTALNTVVEMADRLRDTAQSHERCSVIEVMGRSCGNIALVSGVAIGTTAVLVPEIDFDFELDVVERIENTRRTGKRHFIIVAAEGIFKRENARFLYAEALAEAIAQETGLDVRSTVLGHVQRGGIPSARDRIMAAEMGYLAAELLSTGRGNRVIAVQKGAVCDLDIEEALACKRTFDFELYRMAQDISS